MGRPVGRTAPVHVARAQTGFTYRDEILQHHIIPHMNVNVDNSLLFADMQFYCWAFSVWLGGLGVWFSLRVREVPDSNSGQAQKYFIYYFCLRRVCVCVCVCVRAHVCGLVLIKYYWCLWCCWSHFAIDAICVDSFKRLRCVLFHLTEGNVLFNDALNTFYLRLYGVGHMVKDHSDSEKGNPLSQHELFPINSKGSFICTIPQAG